MDIQHTFEIYQKQLNILRKGKHIGKPQILRQYRAQFKGFSTSDITTLIEYLRYDDKKWFVAHLLDNLDTFPVELLKPLLAAAINDPDPSFNNEFIKPCRRVFDYVDIQQILLDIFRNGDNVQKKSVLNALYWARPTVYTLTVNRGSSTVKQKGYDSFFWDYELLSFNEYFQEDLTVFEREYPRQQAMYHEQLTILLDCFYQTTDTELKYQIALRLPDKIDRYPLQLQTKASVFLHDKVRQGMHTTIAGPDETPLQNNPFIRRLWQQIRRILK